MGLQHTLSGAAFSEETSWKIADSPELRVKSQENCVVGTENVLTKFFLQYFCTHFQQNETGALESPFNFWYYAYLA